MHGVDNAGHGEYNEVYRLIFTDDVREKADAFIKS
jgi:hypothetical protein